MAMMTMRNRIWLSLKQEYKVALVAFLIKALFMIMKCENSSKKSMGSKLRA